MRKILDRDHGLGMDALVVYGLTEATGGTHWTRSGDPIDKRVSTVGLRTPEIEDRIVDSVTGAPLGPGEEGEVCIAGPTLMLGYYKNPARRRKRSATAGSTPGTWASRTPTATSASPAVSPT